MTRSPARRMVLALAAGTAVALVQSCVQPGGGYWKLPDSLKAEYKQGEALADRGRHGEALPVFRGLADQGYPQGEYELGRAYARGLGVARDPAKAVEYLERAAADVSRRRGHAYYELGRLYLGGDGIPRDPARAARYFELALDPQP